MQGNTVGPAWQNKTLEQTKFCDKFRQLKRVLEKAVTPSHLDQDGEARSRKSSKGRDDRKAREKIDITLESAHTNVCVCILHKI